MKTQYSNRPFADEYTASPVQDSLGGIILRSSSAFGGSIAIAAALAAIIAH